MINGPMGVGKTSVGKYIADSNSGTAFIDGDWCLDLHPFVGNKETKEMAIDNIIHMIGNYKKCSECKMIVLVWLMDDKWVRDEIINKTESLGLEVQSVTLTCDQKTLCDRWKNDAITEWRNDNWLKVSIDSLDLFSAMENVIDTTDLTIAQVASKISI